MDFFSVMFFVAIVKMLWDENKSNMFVSFINHLVASKLSPTSGSNGVSKAIKQLDGSYHVDYTVQGVLHTLVIPPQRRKVKWDKAIATLETGETVDVTVLVRPYAGPHGNFMNFDYHPNHLHRGASSLTIYRKNVIVRKFGQ
jgi:hypothetical protein